MIEVISLTYNGYLLDCLDFAEETAHWAALDRKFYTTDGIGWLESCDNSCGGIDVSWAFHLSADEIRKDAPQHYADAIIGLVQLAIDERWDADTMQSLVDQFS